MQSNLVTILMALQEFQRLMDTEGEDAAIAWANEQAALLEGEETNPQLRLVE